MVFGYWQRGLGGEFTGEEKPRLPAHGALEPELAVEPRSTDLVFQSESRTRPRKSPTCHHPRAAEKSRNLPMVVDVTLGLSKLHSDMSRRVPHGGARGGSWRLGRFGPVATPAGASTDAR